MFSKDTVKLTKLVLTSVIVLPNFFGNLLVCLVVMRNKLFHTYINFLLVHLSITDILAGAIALLEALIDIFVEDKSSFDQRICKLIFNQHFVYIAVVSSYSTIIFISVLRYLGISKPLKSMTLKNTKNLKYVISVIWMLSFVSLAPRIYADFSIPGCDRLIALPLLSRVAGGISIVFRGIILPIILPISTLTYTFWKIKRALVAKQNGTTSRKQPALNSKKKATRLLGFIIVVYVFCTVPEYLYAVFRSILSYHHLAHVSVEIVVFCVFIAGSTVNPFLYWFHCRRFRNAASKCLGYSVNRVQPR